MKVVYLAFLLIGATTIPPIISASPSSYSKKEHAISSYYIPKTYAQSSTATATGQTLLDRNRKDHIVRAGDTNLVRVHNAIVFAENKMIASCLLYPPRHLEDLMFMMLSL